MSEYIEREKVKEVIKDYGKGAIEDGQQTLDPVDDILLLHGAIDMIPTADVVEVVRCKDCKHCEHINDEFARDYYQCKIRGNFFVGSLMIFAVTAKERTVANNA